MLDDRQTDNSMQVDRLAFEGSLLLLGDERDRWTNDLSNAQRHRYSMERSNKSVQKVYRCSKTDLVEIVTQQLVVQSQRTLYLSYQQAQFLVCVRVLFIKSQQLLFTISLCENQELPLPIYHCGWCVVPFINILCSTRFFSKSPQVCLMKISFSLYRTNLHAHILQLIKGLRICTRSLGLQRLLSLHKRNNSLDVSLVQPENLPLKSLSQLQP